MSSIDSVEIELEPPPDGPRATGATVRLELLPTTDQDSDPPPLVDLRGNPKLEPGVEPVQVLEHQEYRYTFEFDDLPGPATTDRPNLFFPDDQRGDTGRFRPGLHTGTVPVTVFVGGKPAGCFVVEVRSRKFDYLKHYRWMLRDLTEVFTESVMQRFAASEQQFTIDENRDATTLYQRFALLKSLLDNQHLLGALRHVMNRPHVSWHRREKVRSVRQGLRSSSATAKQLAGPGPRVPFEHGPSRLGTLPRTVSTTKTHSTVDNSPNRFVKFALTRWRNVVAHIREVLESESRPSTPVRRGIREAQALETELTGLLADEFFRDIGTLSHLPSASQVLQKRAGYRAIYKAYIEFEMASKLSWDADDVYGAGQRDVATLYEYWSFLRIVEIIADRCEKRFDLGSLFTVGKNGLDVGLRRGTWQVLKGIATSGSGRQMTLELHYNKQFQKGSGSWTRNLRPDCSLRITPRTDAEDFEDIWLHFDAKYRLNALDEVFDDELEESPSAPVVGEAKGEDLVKMHAYRDAIRRSAGAYVVYPGSKTQQIEEYHEVLPGLGAFPLQPTESGSSLGAHHLARFIDDVIEHAASQVTQHERSRYWSHESYNHEFQGHLDVPPAPFLPRPPADTLVLLGFVRSREQYQWIQEHKWYNLRADPGRDGSVQLGSRELASDLVVLYGPSIDGQLWSIDEDPQLMTRERMLESGYPDPGGEQYFVFPLRPVEAGEWSELLSRKLLDDMRRQLKPSSPKGTPVTTNWLRLVRRLKSAHGADGR